MKFSLTDWLRSQRNVDPDRPAHMTFAQSTVSRALSRTGLFLKQQLWIWPIVAVLVLSVLGYLVRSAIERTMREGVRSLLTTVLNLETSMLTAWLQVEQAHAETLANDIHVRKHVHELLDLLDPTLNTVEKVPLASHPAQGLLQKELAPALTSREISGYFVADKSQRIVAASHAVLIGQERVPQYREFLTRALDGETSVCAPFTSLVSLDQELNGMRVGEPTMFVCAPIRDASFQVIGALALRIRPDLEFTRILQLGQIGSSGETYAFNKEGTLVSNSRFDEQLILAGLLPDREDARSILNISIRDPGGDVFNGHRPAVRRAQLPLTRMAASATAGETGFDVDGYRDYRGVQVVGAWTWLTQYALGVSTEIDYSEAFRPLVILKRTFYTLLALLAVCAVAIFVFTVRLAKLRRAAQKSAIEARQLGQYTLEAKLGAGGMGVVYRGHHAMLRRPTAIKLLDIEKVNDASIQRFEREVQITCQLNNPHTVAIYDYGRTPEGVFYYAMEYLDGINLQTLVEHYGPQPESRVIRILQQACGSLYEAHTQGMVHRDIKPANIMLNRRGGEPDYVKVLDFGLVKAMDEQKQAGSTSSGGLTGTPMYMSPEAIQLPASVDSRSDIYALGAVGYYLLTGQPVFQAATLMELCQQHINDVPVAPSVRIGRPVSPELEHALLACLEKNRARRPQTARDLAVLLAKSPATSEWSLEDAEGWWVRHDRNPGGRSSDSHSSLLLPTTDGANRAVPPSAYDKTFVGGTEEEGEDGR